MAMSSKIKKVAKKLLSLSLDKEGRVDEVKVKSILESLREDPPSNHRALLKEYQSETRRYLPTCQCALEVPDSGQSKVSTILTEKVNNSKENKFSINSSQNPSLIAGYKLRVGDDVYEDSIDQRLENLRKSLS
jgi:F-type H+-transporting ATPase subunit delta